MVPSRSLTTNISENGHLTANELLETANSFATLFVVYAIYKVVSTRRRPTSIQIHNIDIRNSPYPMEADSMLLQNDLLVRRLNRKSNVMNPFGDPTAMPSKNTLLFTSEISFEFPPCIRRLGRLLPISRSSLVCSSSV